MLRMTLQDPLTTPKVQQTTAEVAKAVKVLNKVKDALAGKTPETKDEPTSGTETAAQTPSGESNPKDKKTRKTRAERKTARRYRASKAYLDAATVISTTISDLKKKLKDETSKRRKQALENTINFLENRMEKLKKGEDVTEEPIPPEVSKEITGKILKTKAENATFMGAISGNPVSTQDLDDFLANIEKNKEIANQAFGDELTDYEKKKKELENKGSDNKNEPNKGKETLSQTPSWANNRGTTALRKSGNITSTSTKTSEIKGVGDILAGKGKHDDKTLPGLPTFYVSTVEEWGTGSGIRKDAWKEKLYKFEDIPTSSVVEKFNGMGNETVAHANAKAFTDLNMKNNFIYDDEEETLYYDSAGFTNYKVRNVELTSDGKHLVIKGATNESRRYGKSHATLLRERYWGRY